MRPRVLTGRDHPFLKTARLVAAQSRRAPPGWVLCEGLRVLEEAARSGFAFKGALVTDRFGGTARERSLLNLWSDRRVAVYQSRAGLFATVSAQTTPQGALALVEVPEARPEDCRLPAEPLVVCACGIQDPGNLGAIVRSAAAAGAAAVFSLAGTVSARNDKALRASAGAFFRLPVVEGITARAFLDFCRGRSVAVYRTAPREGTRYFDARLDRGCALVLGNEAAGLRGAEWEALPCITIPMAEGSESLNVAASAAVILFEAFRQRSSRGPAPGEAG